MVSPIQQAVNFGTVTAATTLGYGVGQLTPPMLLVVNGAFNITLPSAETYVPPPPTTGQTTVGANGGFRITINQVAASGTLTIVPATTPAGTDSIVGTTTIGVQNASITLQAVPGLNTWFVVAKV